MSFCGGDNTATSPSGSADPAGASGAISSAGGRVASDDSRLTLTIPAGAVSQPLELRAQSRGGFSYELTPDGVQFALPVTASLDVLAADISFPAGTGEISVPLVLPTLTNASGDAEIVDEVRVNRTGDEVTMRAEIEHFSTLLFMEEATPLATLYVFSSPRCRNEPVVLRLVFILTATGQSFVPFRAEIDSASALANGVSFPIDNFDPVPVVDPLVAYVLGELTTQCNAAGRIDVAGDAAVAIELDSSRLGPGDDPVRQILIGFSDSLECMECGGPPPAEPDLVSLSLKKQTIEHTVNQTACPTKGKPVEICSNVDETLEVSTSCSNTALSCVTFETLSPRFCLEVTPSFNCSTTMSFDDKILIEAETETGKKFKTESEVSVKIQ